MRNVIFVAPFPLETTLGFARAVRHLRDVRLLGVFQEPPKPGLFDDVALVGDALDAGGIADGVKRLVQRYGPPHRITGVLEDIQVQVAQVRAHFGVPGVSVDAARRFRDKGLMKDTLRAAGLPVARHEELRGEADAWAFVEQVGFPIVLKPPAGAGCRATYRIDHFGDLRQALDETRPAPDRVILAEEFLSGAEFSFETLTRDGKPLFHSIGRYFPGPLEVMRNDWIQWVIHMPRDISGPEYDPARKVGFAALKALGLGTALTHMEWFRRGDGSVAIGEIAARPPGAQIVKLMSYAHDVDMARAWARLVVDDAFDGPWERKYSVGIAFLRGHGTGRVAAVERLDEAQRKMGALVVEAKLPQVGAPRASGYEGEGWAIVRHEDDDVVKKAVMDLITTVQVRYA